MNFNAIVTALTLMSASVGATQAGPVAWNVSIGGIGGAVGFGGAVAAPAPVYVAPPICVIAPIYMGPPVMVVPAPILMASPRHHHHHRHPGRPVIFAALSYAPAPVFVAAPVVYAPAYVVRGPGFAQPPVFRSGR